MNSSLQGGPNLWLLVSQLAGTVSGPSPPLRRHRGQEASSSGAASHGLPLESCDAKGHHLELSATSPCTCFNTAPNSPNPK